MLLLLLLAWSLLLLVVLPLLLVLLLLAVLSLPFSCCCCCCYCWHCRYCCQWCCHCCWFYSCWQYCCCLSRVVVVVTVGIAVTTVSGVAIDVCGQGPKDLVITWVVLDPVNLLMGCTFVPHFWFKSGRRPVLALLLLSSSSSSREREREREREKDDKADGKSAKAKSLPPTWEMKSSSSSTFDEKFWFVCSGDFAKSFRGKMHCFTNKRRLSCLHWNEPT